MVHCINKYEYLKVMTPKLLLTFISIFTLIYYLDLTNGSAGIFIFFFAIALSSSIFIPYISLKRKIHEISAQNGRLCFIDYRSYLSAPKKIKLNLNQFEFKGEKRHGLMRRIVYCFYAEGKNYYIDKKMYPDFDPYSLYQAKNYQF